MNDLINNPNQYVGQTVTVAGNTVDFDDPDTPRAFTFEDETDLFFQDELLVVSSRPIVFPSALGTENRRENLGAMVTGQMRQFNRAEIEREAGFQLSGQFDQFEGEPVLVAREVNFLTPVEAIVQNPQTYVGQNVLVRAPVEDDRNPGPNAFVVENENLFFDDELLVVSRQPVTLPAREEIDRRVLLGGNVRILTVAEIEREVGFDLQPELEVEFQNQPILVADWVQIIPQGEQRQQTGAATGTTAGTTPTPGATAQRTPTVTPTRAASPAASPAITPAVTPGASPAAATGPITSIPFDQPNTWSTLAGRPADLTNVEVQSVPSDRVFWVGPSANQRMPVMLNPQAQTPGTQTEGRVDVNPGQMVNIEGELREMPSTQQLQQQFNMPDDVRQALADQPVYIWAENVEVMSR